MCLYRMHTSVLFLDMQASLAPTLVRPSGGIKSLRDTFSIWDLTKRRDDIVADMLNALRWVQEINE